MQSVKRGVLLVVLSATGFGLMPVFAVYAYRSGVNVTTLLLLRFGLAAAIFFAYLFGRKIRYKLKKGEIAHLFILGGVLYTLQSFAYLIAIRYMNVAMVALLFYMYPVLVALLSSIVNREMLTKGTLFSMGSSLFGILMIIGRPDGGVNLIGTCYALGAAVTYSVYIVISNRVSMKISPDVGSSFIILFSGTSFLVIGVITRTIWFHFGAVGWLSAGVIAIFSTVMAIFSFLEGMKATGPTKAAIVSMLEPVVSIVASAILLKQHMTIVQAAGGFLIIAGAIIVVLTAGGRRTIKE